MSIDFLADKTIQLYILIASVLIVWILSLFAIWMIGRRNKRKELRAATEYVLLQVTQSSHADTKLSELEQVRLFEELLNSIVPGKKPITFEIAVPGNEIDIRFFISTPSEYVETIQSQVRRVYERAQVQAVHDYTIFHKKDHTILSDVQLKEFYGLPIRSYKKNNTDTFASILAVFAGVKTKDAGMALQIIVQKATKGKSKEIGAVIKQLAGGKKLRYVKPTNATDKMLGVIQSPKKQDENTKISSESQLLEEKIQEQLYETNIRIGVSANTKERANLLFETIQNRFDQFGLSGFNSFVFTKRKDKKALLAFTFRLFNPDITATLSAEEISSVYHLLSQQISVDNLQWAKTKLVAAPPEIATEGLLLGDNIFHGEKKEIYIPETDRLRHMYIVGQTGTGKTAFIKSMALQDIQNGNGLCIIDPHGDLVDDMLAVVPKHRIDDVIIFDPSNLSHPIGLNMLEYDREKPQEKTFIVNEILSIFYQLFGQGEMTGPVFQQYMRNSLLLLMEGKIDEPATLVEVPRVLTDTSFRNSLLQNITNVPVKQFWREEAEKVQGDAAIENIAPYITSKFSDFISNDYVRPIISQPRSSFSFRSVMDEGKLLFVKLPKGKIGELNARLLGMLTTGKLALAAFSRDDVPEPQRKNFFFYIDEFHNFTTDSISQILSEARKYHLSLTVAHQYMGQLTDSIRGSVLGNVGTTVAFRTSIEDAEILARKFSPMFSGNELAEIENLICVVGMLSNSKPLSPFTMKIRFIPTGSDTIREKVIEYSALRKSYRILCFAKINFTERNNYPPVRFFTISSATF